MPNLVGERMVKNTLVCAKTGLVLHTVKVWSILLVFKSRFYALIKHKKPVSLITTRVALINLLINYLSTSSATLTINKTNFNNHLIGSL